ncbi:MAG TPA: DUF4157 domain-containing protein [Pyrinomonadaceae bacterium]|jgi:hypothetical protein
MRLAPEAHRHIEAFLREQRRSDALRLPPVHVYVGRWSRLLTRTLGITAITLGRCVFVSARVVKRDERGRLTIPARLLAHEAMHVVQYSETGFVGFLFSYLREYWRELRAQSGWGRAARQAAYLAIKHEREAYETEDAYSAWAALVRMRGEDTRS